MSESSSSSKKSVRNCPNCRIRMSSLDLDSHVICVNCRGKSCNINDCCDMCVGWSESQMSNYLRHQASLERKRISKKKAKAKMPMDFATICTGVSEGDIVLSDDGAVRDEVLEGLISSVAGSASNQNVEDLVTKKLASFRSDFGNQVDSKLHTFGANMIDAMNDRFGDLRQEFASRTQSLLSAPHQVQGRSPLAGRQSDPDPDLPQDSESHEVR